jgi:hypothetical protein
MLLADTFTNPLPTSVKATDNGGVKQAIDAYKDGVGVLLVDKPGIETDNTAMNILVYKYGEEAKINNVLLSDNVLLSSTSSLIDKNLANAIKNNNISNIVDTSTYIFKSTATNLVNKITASLISGNGSSGSNPLGLFDGTSINEWNTVRVMYWNNSTNYIEIKVNEPFKIWRSGTGYTTYSSPLKIEIKNINGSYTDVSSYNNAAVNVNNTQWALMTNEIPAGQYRFTGVGLHIDSEWFIEGKVAP